MAERVVLALGGHAISPAGQRGTAAEQTANLWRSMAQVAGLVAGGDTQLVITHGNGPQVGNVLIKNELARDVVPPVPLDWCVAQTQATIGFTIASTLEHELAALGTPRSVVPVVSRVLVERDDPAWSAPSKPIGPHIDDHAEVERRQQDGQHLVATEQGWRRVVPSPRPRSCVDREAVSLLLDHGAVVVAYGGGGIPVVADGEDPLRGVEAVVDKDLTGALLAEELDAACYAVLTDVPGVAVRFASDDRRWLDEVSVAELRTFQDAGEFPAGSMAPKVEAVCRFVERTSGRAAIGGVDAALDVVRGTAGTQVRP